MKRRQMIDPDEGLELRPEVVKSLEAYLASDRTGVDTDDVFRALGLDVSADRGSKPPSTSRKPSKDDC